MHHNCVSCKHGVAKEDDKGFEFECSLEGMILGPSLEWVRIAGQSIKQTWLLTECDRWTLGKKHSRFNEVGLL